MVIFPPGCRICGAPPERIARDLHGGDLRCLDCEERDPPGSIAKRLLAELRARLGQGATGEGDHADG